MFAPVPYQRALAENGVLIIDDDPSTRLFLTKRLEKAGYEPIHVASSGPEGLEIARRHRPMLIICDWMMPTMDGLEVCQQIKSDNQLASTYFILLTARDSVNDLVVGLGAGADEFLTKPVDHRELLARVRAGVRIADLQQQLRETVEQLELKVEVRTRDLRVKSEQLQRANGIKDDFLANVSHELRTPLTSIITALRLLRPQLHERLSDRQQQYFDIIHTSSNHLKVLINDLIDFTQLESNQLAIHPAPSQIGSIVGQALRIISSQASEKQLLLECDLPEALATLPLMTDERRVVQILINLLSNAVKFTPEQGAVRLRIEQVRGRIAFEVKDTGIGIPFEQQPQIFQRFHQLEPMLTKQYGGMGVGLSLSARLAELLNAQILFCSEAGVGSTFRLYLPLGKEPLA